jgi:uncharacterized protein (UPF0335 family)
MSGGIDGAGADQQLGSYIDRILRLRAEADERMQDVAEVLKEAKGNGFDKAAIRAIVNEQRKRAKDSSAVDEAEAVLETYREAYRRHLSHAYTREAAE